MQPSFPRFSFFAVFIAFFLLSGSLIGQTQDEKSIAKMKSMYMLNFSKYVTWPNGVIQDTFFIGVRNDDDVIRNLEEIALVKKVLGKPISVVHLEDFKQVPTLHMLYVNIDPAMDLDAIHASIADAAVLLVTEGYDLEHSMLNFVNDGEHLKYEMNKIVMGTHQLKVDETLENLAIRVIK